MGKVHSTTRSTTIWNSIGFKVFLLSFLSVTTVLALLGGSAYSGLVSMMKQVQEKTLQESINSAEQVLRVHLDNIETQLVFLTSPQMIGSLTLEQYRVWLERTYAIHSNRINALYLLEGGKLSASAPDTIKYFSDPEQMLNIYTQTAKFGFWRSEPYESRFSKMTVTVARSFQKPGSSEMYTVAADLNLDALTRDLSLPSGPVGTSVYLFSKGGGFISANVPSFPFDVELKARSLVQDLNAFTNSDKRLQTYKKGTETYKILRSDSHFWNWTIVAVMNESDAYPLLKMVRTNTLWIVGLWVIFSVAAAYWLATYIRKPVLHIVKQMNRGANGDLNTRIDSERSDEFMFIAVSFNQMMERIGHLFEDLRQMEGQKRYHELKVLQSQINPHFLYNTLNTIFCLSENERANEIGPLIRSMVSVLKFTMDKVDELVMVKDELSNVMCYVELMKLRFGDIFDVDPIMFEECEDQWIPKLTILTLVENAIFYGMNQGEERNHIVIVAKRKSDHIYTIEVSDTGPGMDPILIQQLLGHKAQNSADTGTEQAQARTQGLNNLGIRNIKERIGLHFGDRYGLSIDSVLGEGTVITVQLPYREIDRHGREEAQPTL